MAIERRKDNKGRVLKEGEHQRKNGTYEYKWRDKKGTRHSIYSKILNELREKEIDVLRDVLDGIREDKKNLTINDLYNLWVQLKKGRTHNPLSNYKYMYAQFVQPDFGHTNSETDDGNRFLRYADFCRARNGRWGRTESVDGR